MNSADRIAELEARLEDLEGRLFDLEPFPPRDAGNALLDTLDGNPEDVASAIDYLIFATAQGMCSVHAAGFAAKLLKAAQNAERIAQAGDVCQSCRDKEAGAAPVALTLVGAPREG